MLEAADLRGIIPPTTTPLTAEGGTDRPAVARLMDFFVEAGAAAVFVLGSSGETPLMTRDQKLEVVDAVADSLAGRLPLLAGVTDSSWQVSVELAREFAQMGADALVATCPYFFHYSQQELTDYFIQLAEHSPLPLMIYDIPLRTGNRLALDAVLTLAAHERIIGLKDTTGDLERGMQIARALGPDAGFAIFQGSERLLLVSLVTGYAGGVLGFANVAPRLCQALYEATVAGDLARGRELQALVDQAFPFFFAANPGETHTSGILGAMKVGQELQGLCSRRCLFPLSTLTDEQAERVRVALQPLADAGWLNLVPAR